MFFKINIIILLSLCIFIFGMSGRDVRSVLTKEDIKAERSQSMPALSSPLNDEEQWESYNHWQCFNQQEIEVLCAGVCNQENCLPNEWEKELLVSVLHQEHLFEFSVELPLEKTCEETLVDWKKVLDGQELVCFYAAHLQNMATEPGDRFRARSFWVLDRLKSRSGQWSSAENAR